MSNNQIINPLVAMAGTIVMCLILSACQSSMASSNIASESSTLSKNRVKHDHNSEHHVHIHGNKENRVYYVNGKDFTFDQLTDDQKEKINAIEKQLQNLEIGFELDSKKMEQWGEKMEKVAEKMEIEAEKMEGIMESLKFDGDTHSIRKFSEKMEKASRNLEVKMRALEKQMYAMEIKMPEIDQLKISEIERQARKLEKLLLEISKSI